MANPWFALLKAVPWGEVVKKAPEIAESAKKLWGTVAQKSPQKELEAHTVFATEEQEINGLKDRLENIEAANAELHNQMLATSELIRSLAEQNAGLINSIELNRLYTKKLATFTVIIGLIAAYCMVKIF